MNTDTFFTAKEREAIDRAVAHSRRVSGIVPNSVKFAWMMNLNERQRQYCELAQAVANNYLQAKNQMDNGNKEAAADAAGWCRLRIGLFAPLVEPEFTWR